MNFIDMLIFGIYPYIVSVVFFLGCLIRYDKDQYTWKTGSSQMLSNKHFRVASNLFHIGIIGIFFGHFGGLVIPYEVWHMLGITLQDKQLIAMGAGGFFGVLCFIGLTYLVYRRLFNPRIRASSTRMDTAIVLVIYLQLILGMFSIFISSGHMDGQEMKNLMTWSKYLLTFRPEEAITFISDVHWIYRAHVFWGITLFLLFPFSRLVHIWSVPIEYLTRQYQIVRQK
ncbi:MULTISPECIES: respiratory nitrate reductase subunit gamma [unclassified Salinivibrio]|uniref:respiratory nitrate reductase subunit gamma n=1 Tax=unclassified Salinivibrio TaxID=2636825 RepID=UPI0008481997|nr:MULTISPECIES: respiratory nitrate reductase subunit gamma [unclassified Salinivibrio]ODP96329.1 respiratory nitrate reductase subunit gamma [Salinivibrio sp. BNH]ODQ00513.1 respiratory nitrate reductase subunit gamma [Salinivibrio sp. DV]